MVIQGKYKSLFLLPGTLLSVSLTLFAFVMAGRAEHDYVAWLGAAAAAMPLPLVLLRLHFVTVPRASENEPLAVIVSLAGTFLAAWEMMFEGAAGWPAPVLAAGGSGLLLLYVFWYSRYGRIASGHLDVGSRLPDFSLRDASGRPVASGDLLGHPAVVVFYHGNWCPLCRAQVAEIARRFDEFERLDTQVVLISPQPAEKSRELAALYDGPLRFWVDEGNQVAESLDIAVHHGVPLGVSGEFAPDTAMPTAVATNANGTILFCDQTDNFRVRPEPDAYIAVVRRAGAIAR